jgi:hypothetical protein
MRTLLAGALAAVLAGCSSQSLPQPVASARTDANLYSFKSGRSTERRLALVRTNGSTTMVAATETRRERPAFARTSFRKGVGPSTLKSSVTSANAELPSGNAVAGSNASTATNLAGSSSKNGAAADSNTRTVRDQVAAATAMAERMTAASAVALVMAGPEIKSVSDLANRNVAIDARLSASNSNVRTAIVSAGAPDVQLSEAQSGALDRVISGESPAAVLTLVSPDAADQFPDVSGYKIFRIQLSQRPGTR